LHQLPLHRISKALTRVACVHVGTPKTGTTALQIFLGVNHDRLLEAGVLYPRAGDPHFRGQPTMAHHELVRELHREGPGPQLAAVVAEIASSDAPLVVLSSEEFHALPPAQMTSLVDALRSAEYVPIAVVYLRAQPFYAESVYVELLKAGLLSSFDAYLAEIVGGGAYVQPDSGARVEFEYSRLVSGLESSFGAGMVVPMAYRPERKPGAQAVEFLGYLGRLRGEMHVKGLVNSTSRVNESQTLRGVIDRLYALAGGRPPANLGIFEDDLNARFSLLSFENVVRFYERFAGDNRSLNARFGIEIPFAAIGDVPSPDDPRFARAQRHREIFGRIIETLGLL